MKNTLMLAGLASIVLACNNNTASDSADAGKSNHAAHNDTNSAAKVQDQVNPVKETMDKMMRQMHAMKTTGNNGIDFAAMMVEHHKGAVEMSKVEMDKGSNAEMKAFAQKVIDDQEKEIKFMQNFISEAPKTTSSNSAGFQKALNASMMAMMDGNTTIFNNIDKDFAAQMIPHHQSAVDMAKAYLQYGHEVSLQELCRNIISSQTKEITWLKEWLARNEK